MARLDWKRDRPKWDRPGRIGPSGIGQAGSAQAGSAQAGSAQAGSAQAGSAQAGSAQAGSASRDRRKRDRRKWDSAQAGFGPSGIGLQQAAWHTQVWLASGVVMVDLKHHSLHTKTPPRTLANNAHSAAAAGQRTDLPTAGVCDAHAHRHHFLHQAIAVEPRAHQVVGCVCTLTRLYAMDRTIAHRTSASASLLPRPWCTAYLNSDGGAQCMAH
jgi:hypothetical protein